MRGVGLTNNRSGLWSTGEDRIKHQPHVRHSITSRGHEIGFDTEIKAIFRHSIAKANQIIRTILIRDVTRPDNHHMLMAQIGNPAYRFTAHPLEIQIDGIHRPGIRGVTDGNHGHIQR